MHVPLKQFTAEPGRTGAEFEEAVRRCYRNIRIHCNRTGVREVKKPLQDACQLLALLVVPSVT